MCKIFLEMFSKKTPKKWTFDSKPVVNWTTAIKCKYDMVMICKLILTKILGIEDVELTVVTNDTQIKIFDTPDFELRAMLLGVPTLKKYTLILRSNVGASEVLSIVCHEMWHLSQMYHGQLQIVGKDFKWKGKSYPGSMPYFDRPWEKEAIIEQAKIEKQVKKLYYE